MEINYKKCLYHYKNGNYIVTILNDGTKIRQTKDNKFVPSFPESIDVKITDKCDGKCTFCYENSTEKGRHSILFNKKGLPLESQKWLTSLYPGIEIALNGNDLTHSDLNPENPRLLKYLKNKGAITNITVNQRHFIKHYKVLKKWYNNKLIYGLGISLCDSRQEEFYKILKEFPNAVIHVINGIFNYKDFLKLKDKNLKLLILGYKKSGRGAEYFKNHKENITLRMDWLKTSLKSIINDFSVIAFDNLALSQLNIKNNLFYNKKKCWDEFYLGDDGFTSFYIDAVKEQYSKNSIANIEDKYSSINLSIYQMFDNLKIK